jgi:ABC-type antimicrobial peptide transport system permease subunit
MEEIVEAFGAPQRFRATLLTAFAAIAFLLAVFGINGFMAFSVARRTREIGVRMSLGAESRSILLMFLSEAGRLTFAGAAIGLLGAWALNRLIAGYVFGVRPSNMIALACVALLLVGGALGACLLPAYRASRTDPMAALRYE